MSGGKFDLSDYVPVNERILAFLQQHPDGALQSEIVELTEDRVTVKAYAYRSPDDPRPGVGHSSLQIPGRTPYTLGSEIENAETSAWGRAIAALGFEVKRGLASAEEVRNKNPEPGARGGSPSSPSGSASPAPALRTPEEQALLDRILAEPGMSTARMSLMADAVGVPKGDRANAEQLQAMVDRYIGKPADFGEFEHPEQARGPEVGRVAPDAAPAGTPAPESQPEARAHAEPAEPEPADTPAPASKQDESSASGASVGGGVGANTPGVAAPSPDITDEQILAAAGEGAEMIPPKPRTPEYGALTPPEKATARAFWAEREKAAKQPAAQIVADLVDS